jgi:DNA-binding transcriptional ArsR family regulator
MNYDASANNDLYRFLQHMEVRRVPLDEYESVMKAAGDPVRARILKLVQQREMCVCELIEILGLSQSTVSGHLTILKNAGLVEDRKEGRWAYYSLAGSKKNTYTPSILALLMGGLDDDAQVRADRRRQAAMAPKAPGRCD